MRADPVRQRRGPFVRLAVLVIFALAVFGAPAGAFAADAPVRSSHVMIAAAHPAAAEAGARILSAGGDAIDAAIAAQMVLGLVEPQSSGIGGGGFLLYYDTAQETVESYDGRETAPAAAAEPLFLAADGTPRPWPEAAVGGLPVGVPGVVRMLERAHRAHGRTPWAHLFEPAAALAERGFAITPRLAHMIEKNADLARFPDARAYFFHPDGSPKRAGETLVNPAYAETMRAIAREGADALHEGRIAAEIVATVQGDPVNPGALALADLAGYRARVRLAVCGDYRRHRVCSMGPPSSGGVTLLQILGLLERFDLAALTPGSVEAVHLISEASRLAFADRNRYLADTDFVPVPVAGLLDPDYLRRRSALIDPDRAIGEAAPGAPPGSDSLARADAASPELASTSHLSVVDSRGNAVSFTTSVERAFGSRLMAAGFILNNQLTDFSFAPTSEHGPVANRVQPGKRPRSSMTPTLIFDEDGSLFATLGSPGGPRIIGFVAQSAIALLDWSLDAQAALSLPRHVNRNGATELEAGTALEEIAPALEALGHEIRIRPLVSGLHAIRRAEGMLEGGADPRREGIALGH
ncbi:MAG: gamma-glutamyltransferase [Rhodospirillales bacterium]|nr:gamma-glutamyltransferase [Rhodospirillales bacterium]